MINLAWCFCCLDVPWPLLITWTANFQDPSKFAAAAAAPVAAVDSGGAAPAAASKVEEKEESAEDSDEDLVAGLFD